MERIEVLKGERISLVVPEREDAVIWYKGMNNIETQSLINQRGNMFYLEDEYEYYENLKKWNNQRTFSIYIQENEKIIGNISLMNISEKNRNAVMGIMICDTEEQNKGYGTEAVKLILKYGFEVLGLHKIRLDVIATNPRAQKVYEKCGFQVCGVFKEEIFHNDIYIDHIKMEILRKEYFSKR